MGKMKYETLTADRIEEAVKNNSGSTSREILDHLEIEINGSTMERVRQIAERISLVDIQKKGRTNYFYYIEPVEEKEEELPVKEDNPYKNAERYNDPTAGRAIERVDGPSNNSVTPAAIYRTVKNELFLVVRQYPDTVLGYKVLVVDKGNVTTDSSVVWSDRGAHNYLVNTNRVCSINWRTLILSSFQRCPFDAFRDILRRSPFNQNRTVEVPVEKEVVKEVIKEVEVPVEVVKEVVKEVEVPVETDNSGELALAYQRIAMLEDFNKKLYDLLKGMCK